ncbi:hypothetical protein ISP15_08150 [Dyella jejuensis]|uniref:Integron gene cassette protein n=1 Tax=Dyella jejuensis TaxID=1432009 RepID=A0ABW8JGT5_9GAMM
MDILDYLPTWQERDGWRETTYWLKQNFDDVCLDTFCEGEYPNLEALSYRCSVDAGTGYVTECIWVFAASREEISPADGKVVVEPRIWQCPSPIASMTRAQDLAAALANDNPLRSPLPHSDTTLYDSLLDCL